MNTRNVNERSVLSRTCLLDLLPEDGVRGDPARLRRVARRAPRDTDASTASSAMEPVPVEPERDELVDDRADVLAGDVAEHEVARGLDPAAGEVDDVRDGVVTRGEAQGRARRAPWGR